MAKYKTYIPTTPGFAGVRRICDYHNPVADGFGGGLGTTMAARMNQVLFSPIFSGMPLDTSSRTETLTGTGAAIAAATTGGLLITCGSSSTFNTNLESICAFTPVSTNCVMGAGFKVQVSAITGIGFSLGFGNSQALPTSSEYTDCVILRKSIGAATVVGKVRGDSGTAANSATLLTLVNATEVTAGFTCGFAGDGSAFGQWFTDDGTGQVITPFTSDQLTQLTAILTTPPSMHYNIEATGVTGTNPTMTVSRAYAFVDFNKA